MVYSLSYRRPGYVSRSSVGSSDGLNSSNTSLDSVRSGILSGIPEALSFDKIVNGGTCPVSVDIFSYTYHLMHLCYVLKRLVECLLFWYTYTIPDTFGVTYVALIWALKL